MFCRFLCHAFLFVCVPTALFASLAHVQIAQLIDGDRGAAAIQNSIDAANDVRKMLVQLEQQTLAPRLSNLRQREAVLELLTAPSRSPACEHMRQLRAALVTGTGVGSTEAQLVALDKAHDECETTPLTDAERDAVRATGAVIDVPLATVADGVRVMRPRVGDARSAVDGVRRDISQQRQKLRIAVASIELVAANRQAVGAILDALSVMGRLVGTSVAEVRAMWTLWQVS